MQASQADAPLLWIEPQWPAPAQVRAISTTRRGGFSRPPYAGLNLADHVGDGVLAVARNRRLTEQELQLPSPPVWLRQQHGIRLVAADACASECPADGSYTRVPGVVCAVLTADCIPILLCDRQGSAVAAVHAGWRGLSAGIVERAVQELGAEDELLAWMGPAIGADAYEVGEEVREALLARVPDAEGQFVPRDSGRWLADLAGITRKLLHGCGVAEVTGARHCTYSEPALFFSHRRDGITGRMATMIWLDPSA